MIFMNHTIQRFGLWTTLWKSSGESSQTRVGIGPTPPSVLSPAGNDHEKSKTYTTKSGAAAGFRPKTRMDTG